MNQGLTRYLCALLPDKAGYADVIKVIDLPDLPASEAPACHGDLSGVAHAKTEADRQSRARILGDIVSQQVICFLP